MNRDWLGKIEGVIADAVKAQNIPGANVLVYKDGVEQYRCEEGWADIEERKPLRRDTIFRLYSMTKPIVGASAMLLMQNGRLDLNEPVSKFIPGFKNQSVHTENGPVPVIRDVRIKELLNMTSGIMVPRPDTEAGRTCAAVWSDLHERLDSDNPMTTFEFADRLGQCGLCFQPGEHWQYGASADVMAAVAEVVTGKRFGEFLRDELLGPLGMDDTDFYVPAEKQHRLARTYSETPDGMVQSKGAVRMGYPISLTMEKPPVYESGGAGLASTADDYMKFAQMLLNDGVHNGKQILAPRTVGYFTSPSLGDVQMKDLNDVWDGGLAGFNYGNLMRIMAHPGKSVFINSLGEYGWDGALGVYFMNSPKDKLTFLFMTQRNGSGTLNVTRRIRNIIYSSL